MQRNRSAAMYFPIAGSNPKSKHIETWVDYKRTREIAPIRLRAHPRWFEPLRHLRSAVGTAGPRARKRAANCENTCWHYSLSIAVPPCVQRARAATPHHRGSALVGIDTEIRGKRFRFLREPAEHRRVTRVSRGLRAPGGMVTAGEPH